MTLIRELVHHRHVHRLVVTATLQGWNLQEEMDAILMSRWHRAQWRSVEHDVLLFDTRAATAKRRGWVAHNTHTADTLAGGGSFPMSPGKISESPSPGSRV